jgi:predicted RNA binding protein YcfA (HicA-like mRNA interferase family)
MSSSRKTVKLLEQLRQNSRNTPYRTFLKVVMAYGFEFERQRGSHEIYQHPVHPDLRLNLQPRNGLAKDYQIRDFLKKIEDYNIDHG